VHSDQIIGRPYQQNAKRKRPTFYSNSALSPDSRLVGPLFRESTHRYGPNRGGYCCRITKLRAFSHPKQYLVVEESAVWLLNHPLIGTGSNSTLF
jgi:ribosomal protein L17